MIINNAKYELTAVKPIQYPVNNLPEVCYVGRSNVGKSSIINTLLNRKNLARVGATPGKTREINFYNIDDKLYFVDLPGYGYANVSKEKKVSWEDVVETYLFSRQQLKLIVMLVDIRHTPSKDDKTMYEWIIRTGMPHFLVASKADKISRGQYNPRISDIRKTLGVSQEVPIVPFSAESRQGKEQILDIIGGTILE